MFVPIHPSIELDAMVVDHVDGTFLIGVDPEISLEENHVQVELVKCPEVSGDRAVGSNSEVVQELCWSITNGGDGSEVVQRGDPRWFVLAHNSGQLKSTDRGTQWADIV